MAKEVCFYPRFNPRESGGVAMHVRLLTEQLRKRGWSVVDRPEAETIVHCHAQARAPQVDVYTNHGIYPLRDDMPNWQRQANAAIFDNLKLATEVIVVSRWTASQWQHLVGRAPRVIYNSIDLNEWRNVERGRWRGRLGLDAATPLIVWGKTSINAVLDPTPLIELALRYPTWQFVAPLAPTMLFTAPKNLKLIGAQPYNAMQMLLADCDVYLATVCENHSIQVLEAMALAKPILAYNWGGTAETLDATCAVLVAPHDLVDLAAKLPEARARAHEIGPAAHARVAEHFTVEKQMEKLLEVYEVVETRKGRKPGTVITPPRCSIIIPVYNKEAWIGETLTSALRQVQAPKYEIIVVNDGSTDDSLAAARRVVPVAQVANQPRVHIFDIPNGGVSAARNFGIAQAKGEYIACLDADDLIDPHFLNRLTAALDADPGLGIAYSDFMAFGTDNKGMPFEAGITCDEYDFDKLKRGNLMPCCNLFRKTAWERAGGYKPINPSWEDYELWLNMGKLGWYGRRVPGTLFWYRKVPKVGRDFESQGQEWRLRAIVNSYHRDLYPPAVSVVIPCYKHSQFLVEAIDSVTVQTFADWEVVVVDDGNEAEEAAAIQAICEKYDPQKVRLVRLNENGGLANARNTGIDMANGTWIVPLDADDKLASAFMEKTLRATNLDPKKFAYPDATLWWSDGSHENQRLEAHEYDFDEMIVRITWGCTIMFAKQAWREVGGYKPQMSAAGGWEDWEFAINLGANGICGVRVPEALFFYRQHSQEQMRIKAEAHKSELQEALRRIHAGIYAGERPTMCCGGNRNRASSAAAKAAAQPPAERMLTGLPVAARAAQPPQEVLLRYVGARSGSILYAGPSGRRYRFGRSAPVQRVLASDADFFVQTQEFQKITA